MTTHGDMNRNNNAAAFTSVVLLVTFGLILGLLLIGSGVAKTPEQVAALRATDAPTLIPPTVIPPTSAPAAAASYDAKMIAAGQDVFSSTCFACHGMNAKGIPGLGKDLIDSSFVHGLTDQALVEFIAHGRAITDPLNTTGVAMPARGGNPALTDAQLADVVAYIRTLTLQDNGGDAPAQAQPTTASASTAAETPFVLPIDSVLQSSSDTPEAAASVPVAPTAVPSDTPTLRLTPAATEVPFALPIDSVLAPSGG